MDYFNNAVKPACSRCLSPLRASVIPSKRRSVCRETDGLYWWRKLLASLAGETDPGVERAHLDEIRSGGPPFAPAKQASSMVPKDSGKRGLTFGNEASLSLDFGKFDYFRVAPAAGLP